MGLYEQNKEELQKRYPELLNQIENRESEVSHGYEVEIIETRDGNNAVVVKMEGKKIRLNSAYRPLEEAKKWADQYEFQNIGVNILMFGFGNGYFVRELLHRAAKDAKVFLWEPKVEIFRFVIHQEDLSDIFADNRLSFFIGEEGLQKLKRAIENVIGWHNIVTQIRCNHICYEKIYQKEYHQFFDVLDAVNANVRMRRDTNAWFAHTVVENVFRNLKFIKHSNLVMELIGKIDEDIPAIVVAAGPSLEKNVELLKKAYGKALIIATDTAVRILEPQKLPYDCIVTVDPRKPQWYLTKYPGCKEKPLFCETQTQADIMEFHTGRKLWTAGSIFIDSLYAPLGFFFPPYDAGGSVATAGAVLAMSLGLKKIILIGQDLAYKGEQTHAGGFQGHIRNEAQSIEYVEGIDGNQVKTRYDWNVYRKWFENLTKEHEEITLVDATEGGALIHGAKVLSFEEAIDTYCNEKRLFFDDIINNLPETFTIWDYEPIRKQIIDMSDGLEKIKKKSIDGRKAANEFLSLGRKISAKKHDRLFGEIKKANNYINRQPGYELVETYTYDLTLGDIQKINKVTGDVYEDEKNSVKIALAVYESYIQAIKAIEDKLQEALLEI